MRERDCCSSDAPRRGARPAVPIIPAFGVMWVGDASRSLRGNTRAFGTLPYHPPAKLAPPRPLSEVEGTREESAFLPLLIYAPSRNSEIRHHPQPLHGRNNDREHLPPSPPQQMPRLPIALPPRALALNIRIEPQILASRKRLHRNHIPHITRLNVHHQRINLIRRISRLPLPIHAINILNFVPARTHSPGHLDLPPPQF